MPPIRTEDFEQLEITDAAQLRTWLEQHHAREESLWLVTYKKSAGARYVDRWDVLDELICFGWIDGIRRKLDAERTMQLIGPRRVEHWAKTYKDRAARLTAEGRMHASGLRGIEAAKASGAWTFMDDVDALVVPDDLARGLAAKTGATEFFDALAPARKRFALCWLKLAKTERTRTNRIAKLAELSARGERLPGS